MGQTQGHGALSDAAGGRPAGGLLARLALNESGATAVEYGLILALMFLAIVGAIQLFAANTGSMFDRIGESMGAVL